MQFKLWALRTRVSCLSTFGGAICELELDIVGMDGMLPNYPSTNFDGNSKGQAHFSHLKYRILGFVMEAAVIRKSVWHCGLDSIRTSIRCFSALRHYRVDSGISRDILLSTKSR